MTRDLSSDLADCLVQLHRTLEARVQIVNALIAFLIKDPSGISLRKETEPIPDVMVVVLAPLLQAMGSSTNSLLKLSDAPLKTRDCFSISRSVVELGANICYIIAKGQDAAERGITHARQKAFRDLTRESQIGSETINFGVSASLNLSATPGLAEEIAQFTSNKGREKNWTDENIDQRIAAAGQLSKRILSALHYAHVVVYRYSSEILHGTYFGTRYLFGRMLPNEKPNSPADLLEYLGEQLMMVLMATGLAHQAVTDAFHIRYGFAAAKEGRTH